MKRKLYVERLGLGDRLRAARKRRGLRQLDAAREIGVCRETIARIEVDHIPSDLTRAKVRAWLAAQEELAAAERPGAARSAAARPARAGRPAGGPESGDGRRPAGLPLRLSARLALRRRARRVYRKGEAARAKAAERKKGNKRRR